MQNIEITNIVVKKFRIICIVKLNSQKYSNEEIKSSLLKLMPNLAVHKCKNFSGNNFETVMSSTSLAHILEHMIIDIQSKHTDEVLLGTTEWIDKDTGLAKIELNYTDDLVCLSAIQEAQMLLNNIMKCI